MLYDVPPQSYICRLITAFIIYKQLIIRFLLHVSAAFDIAIVYKCSGVVFFDIIPSFSIVGSRPLKAQSEEDWFNTLI